MEISVQKLSRQDLVNRGIYNWPIWEKEVSRFAWSYSRTEECYILEGEVTIETPDGREVSFGKDDFVTFPSGLSCTWIVKKPVKKHYNFK
ncbi:MAG: cupin domain-containing protein [Candidatus Omnitrophota bacterium]|nr:cupin domain-containing protein [Candidatus Omnitrophota bacterium]MBU1928334.1 cupin domain-containing protein [Candidatus Omnitrophota bacterium]MBU2034350.1 cupin domain-containing protein [Candidatus Omnitrophota bacterium]MBU2222336.1 cupin domain-containing protein [Candidatus Omnitrophota bacterium]MBU2258122.1 cupin domain-containing protein [Candidatus Omnitrophota bacterium]